MFPGSTLCPICRTYFLEVHLCLTAGYCFCVLLVRENTFMAEADEGATAESSQFCVLIEKHLFLEI